MAKITRLPAPEADDPIYNEMPTSYTPRPRHTKKSKNKLKELKAIAVYLKTHKYPRKADRIT